MITEKDIVNGRWLRKIRWILILGGFISIQILPNRDKFMSELYNLATKKYSEILKYKPEVKTLLQFINGLNFYIKVGKFLGFLVMINMILTTYNIYMKEITSVYMIYIVVFYWIIYQFKVRFDIQEYINRFMESKVEWSSSSESSI